MTYKIGDKLKLLTSFYEDEQYSENVSKGSVLDVVQVCRTEGQWIDQTSVQLDFLCPPYNHDNEFEIVEEEKVKNKFAVGDRVISNKSNDLVPEGFIGFIDQIYEKAVFPYCVRSEKNGVVNFREDELELLSATNTKTRETKPDVINSPKHYAVFEQVEAIQVIASSMTQEQFYGYCLGNILKYRLRAGGKDDVMQELGKADKYQELYTEHKHLCKEGK